MQNNYTTPEGREFSFGKLPAYDSVRVQVMVMKALGEPLFKAAASMSGGVDRSKLGELALGGLMDHLDEDEMIRLIDMVMKVVTVREDDGKPARVNVEQHFRERPRDLWLVLVQALRYNFSDFLPESLFNSLKGKLGQVLSQSTPQTSSGTSGDQ